MSYVPGQAPAGAQVPWPRAAAQALGVVGVVLVLLGCAKQGADVQFGSDGLAAYMAEPPRNLAAVDPPQKLPPDAPGRAQSGKADAGEAAEASLRLASKGIGPHVDSNATVVDLLSAEQMLAVDKRRPPDVPKVNIVEGEPIAQFPEYRLGPGDVVELVYHVSHDKTPGDYRLEVQDRITVAFPFQPQFSSSVLVRNDGKISLPLVGDVPSYGKSTAELAADLNKRYGKYIVNPQINVTLEEFNVKIEELKRTITTAPRGQSKIAPVAPDGRISLPVIGNMQASGFSVRKLEEVVNAEYHKVAPNIKVTCILETIRNSRVYVFGEVNTPGAVDMQGRFDLPTVLALAGGHRPSANIAQIVVIRHEGLTRPMLFTVDVGKVLKGGEVYADLALKPGDVVFVPKTWLDNVNDYIAKIFTRGIYAVAPVTGSFSMTYDITPARNNGSSTTTIPQ